MKKIIIVLLLFSWMVEVAQEIIKPKIGYVRREYRKFVVAFQCMRRSGFSNCSSSQKKRIVIAGLVVVAGTTATYRSFHVCFRKKLATAQPFFFRQQNACFDVSCSEQAKEEFVLTVDLDDVMSGNEVNIPAFMRLLRKAFARDPGSVLRALPKLNDLKNQGKEHAKTMKGASNIIQTILDDLKNQGCDFTEYQDEIVKNAINPQPIKDMVCAIASLKKAGFKVVGATNQDYKIFTTYKAKMDKLGIPMDSLFDWVLTTRAWSQEFEKTDAVYVEMPDNVYMLTGRKIAKPDAEYYKALKDIADERYDSGSKTFIHTDDSLGNIKGAQEAGFKGIHFEVPPRSVFSATKQGVDEAVKNWKASLGEKGIAFQKSR